MASSVTLVPNLLALIAGHAEVEDEIRKAGEKVLAAAKQLCPVDTGALQESGHVEMSERNGQLVALVTFSTRYAVYVEFGTIDTPTFAFLRGGAEAAGYRLGR